uniref:Uncharacterized protein n=1 Tax=Macrostomum lignano TaxID=282301 RepID=A0A1I8IY69_9PLAT
MCDTSESSPMHFLTWPPGAPRRSPPTFSRAPTVSGHCSASGEQLLVRCRRFARPCPLWLTRTFEDALPPSAAYEFASSGVRRPTAATWTPLSVRPGYARTGAEVAKAEEAQTAIRNSAAEIRTITGMTFRIKVQFLDENKIPK